MPSGRRLSINSPASSRIRARGISEASMPVLASVAVPPWPVVLPVVLASWVPTRG